MNELWQNEKKAVARAVAAVNRDKTKINAGGNIPASVGNAVATATPSRPIMANPAPSNRAVACWKCTPTGTAFSVTQNRTSNAK